MANNLRKFNTEADYSAATLNYPAVSWVVSGDTVHYDLSGATPTVNTKVKIAFTTDSCGSGKEFTVAGDNSMINDGIVTAITVNGEALQLSSSMVALQLSANTDYLIEYSLADNVTDVGSAFYIFGAEGCDEASIKYDILFPSQVTNISGIYSPLALIFESTTPPTTSLSGSDIPGNIFVPDSAVSTYEASAWYSSSNIHPISDYSGNIPV